MTTDNPPDNRKVNIGLVFLTGLVSGVVCYLLAESLIPKQVAGPGDHDIFLADRLGLIYTPLLGLWLGWLQRSFKRAMAGLLTGVVIGFFYIGLCASRDFLAIMVGFPCLLGGVMAGLLGSNRSRWLIGLPWRLAKGLLAGLVLGFVYMLILNTLPGLIAIPDSGDFTQRYVYMMWRTGPVALGIASALFFVLMRWAVGLTRAKRWALRNRMG